MHLLIPFASALGESASHTLKDLALPHLARALGRLQPSTPRLGSDEYSLSPPHEAALAQALGWPLNDGALPMAAWAAQADGIPVGPHCWAQLTPLHLSVGSDQVTALHPAVLQLQAEEARALFEALAELFPAEEGWQRAFGDALRWYVAHPNLQGLAVASLDRVMGRAVEPWMPEPRRLRTLQNEVQMLLHNHALNEAREARRQLPVNSVWISGCGAMPTVPAQPAPQIDWRLREPLLHADWATWAEAWRALDAGPIAQLLSAAEQGQDVTLTLCGERFAQTWQSAPRPWWRRLWQPAAATAPVLEAL